MDSKKMRRYPKEHYYVGVINLANSLDQNEISHLGLRGAIDISINNSKTPECYYSKKYFTLFYRIDENNYLCLHNNKVYSCYPYGQDYCEMLEPLANYFPKMSFVPKKMLNMEEALTLFHNLFYYQRIHYQKNLFPISNFYFGEVSLCDSVIVRENQFPYSKTNVPVNVGEKLLLSPYYIKNGEMIIRDYDDKTVGYNRGIYQTLFYFQNNVLYSLNSYQVYRANTQGLEKKARVYHSLEEELLDHGMSYSHEIPIQRALAYQKKLLNKK